MNQQGKLKRDLKPRHIMMMTLGGTIGAGIFKGSSSAIDLAGPGVIFTYIFGGLILFYVMRSLANLAMTHPKSNTLKDLIEYVLGDFAGYFIGWIFWFDWVLVMAAEMTAAASFLQYWFPNQPLWLLAFMLSIGMTLLNLSQVKVFGETEYWLAGIKVFVLLLYIVFGLLLIFTNHHPIGHVAQNWFGNNGLFPHGIKGLISAMLVVIFSFGGIEMIGMTLAETDNPTKTIRRAVNRVFIRVLLFYILPIAVTMSLVPWSQLSQNGSPFVSVFQKMGIPFVGGLMNFVLLTAVLSAVNTGMYATSRMLYVQAVAGNAPRFFSTLTKGKVPVRALLVSCVFLYAGVLLAFFAKGHTFDYLMVFPGFAVLVMWGLLVMARIKSKSTSLAWLILFCICAIVVGIIKTTPLLGTILTLSLMGFIVLSYLIRAITRRIQPLTNSVEQ